MFDQWFEELEKVAVLASRIFISEATLSGKLSALVQRNDSPLTRMDIRMSRGCGFESLELNIKPPHVTEWLADPTHSFPCDLKDPYGAEGQLKIWSSSPSTLRHSDVQRLKTQIELILGGFWNGHLVDETSRIISGQTPATYGTVTHTLNELFKSGRTVACVFSDLDKFKRINDELNQATGDRVIREFSRLAYKVARPNGIAIHRSGDEFYMLLPDSSNEDAIELAFTLYNEVTSHNFNVNQIPVSISSGIVMLDGRANESTADFKSISTIAEKAIKLVSGEKLRGTARIGGKFEIVQCPISASLIQLAGIVLKADSRRLDAFGNPWLNVISRIARNSEWESIKDATHSFLNWCQPSFTNDIKSSCAASQTLDVDPAISRIDVVFAVANGVLAKNADVHLTLRYAKDCTIAILLADSKVLFSLGLDGDNRSEEDAIKLATETFVIGRAHFASADEHRRTVLLVKIGQLEDIPEELFAATIVIDDRPYRGGGLPDFWAATLASVVTEYVSAPQIKKILVVGDQSLATTSVHWLSNAQDWKTHAEVLSKKTGISAGTMAYVGEAISESVEFVEADSWQTAMWRILEEQIESTRRKDRSLEVIGKRFLDRSLQMREFSLNYTDGFRAKTIAQAYPIAVEVLRKSEMPSIQDSSGRILNELIDFKIVLSEPLSDQVPAFYSDEAESLEKYVTQVFDADDSLFGKPLSSQTDKLVQRLSSAIHQGSYSAISRRWILVVPNDVSDQQHPLGLVCIRVNPRRVNDRVVLDYSFVWRTVEVLVGFPYSIFGSVRFAHKVTSAIKKSVTGGQVVEVGSLTYTAMSFHMQLDQAGIARSIVDDASR